MISSQFILLYKIRPDTSYMYDNGQNGDITNGDGIYSFAATVLNTPQVEGEYTYRFIAEDNDGALSEPLEKVIAIGESTSPYIYDLTSPEYMQIEFPGTYKLSINVSDPQGLADINSVFILIENPQGTIDSDTSLMLDNGIGDDEVAGDGIYSYTMSDHGDYSIEGNYVFHFYATDLNDSLSNELTDTIAIDSRSHPFIYDLVAPDSLRKGSTVAAFLSVRLWDPQGNDNVDSVYFYVYRPDGTTSGNNFYMFDDGEVFVSGDSTANDSIYSRGILPPDTSNQSGMYTFYFTAIDAQGNQANILTRQILAYDPVITNRKNTGEYIRSKRVPNVW